MRLITILIIIIICTVNILYSQEVFKSKKPIVNTGDIIIFKRLVPTENSAIGEEYDPVKYGYFEILNTNKFYPNSIIADSSTISFLRNDSIITVKINAEKINTNNGIMIFSKLIPGHGFSEIGDENNRITRLYVDNLDVSNFIADNFLMSILSIDTLIATVIQSDKINVDGNKILFNKLLPAHGFSEIGNRCNSTTWGYFDNIRVKNKPKILTLKDFDTPDKGFFVDSLGINYDYVTTMRTGNNTAILYYNDRSDTTTIPDHEFDWSGIDLMHTCYKQTHPTDKFLTFQYQTVYDTTADSTASDLNHRYQSALRVNLQQDTSLVYASSYREKDNDWHSCVISKSDLTNFNENIPIFSVIFTMIAKRQRSVKIKNVILY